MRIKPGRLHGDRLGLSRGSYKNLRHGHGGPPNIMERTDEVPHNRDGALADERDRHRVGTDAVAHDAAGGVGSAEKGEP
jgi:hypothetical protein